MSTATRQDSAPIVITGTVRSGTTLLGRVLSAHPEIEIASDPYLPLFRSFRNAIVRQQGSDEVRRAFPPSAPLQDGYYTREKADLIRLIDAATLDLPIEQAERAAVVESCRGRSVHESPDLIPHMDRLRGDSYREMFSAAFDLIRHARGAHGAAYVGVKEVWVLDFLPSLLRAFPKTRCLVVTRDPRPVLASVLRLAAKNPDERAHPLSVLRHWRKYQALLQHYRTDPALAAAVHAINYEDLVRKPAEVLDGVCRFLGLPYDDRMTAADSYVRYDTGAKWKGNSSYEATEEGISTSFVDRWVGTLDPALVDLTDIVCGPEASLAGLHGSTSLSRDWDLGGVLRRLLEDDAHEYAWRGDLGNPQLDLAWDLSRYALLAAPPGDLPSDLVAQSFLFPEVLAEIRSANEAPELT